MVVLPPLVAIEMPVPAETVVDAVQVGTPASQESTCPLVPPVRVNADGDAPRTETGLESARTPEAVSEVVAAL